MSRDLRLRFVLDALDRVTAPLQDITRGAGATAKALKETRGELKGLESQQKQASGFRRQQQDIAANNAALDEARRRQRALQLEIASTANPTKKLAAELARTTRNIETLERRGASGAATLQRLSAELRHTGVDVARLGDHERRLASDIDAANRRMTQQQAALERANAARSQLERRQAVGDKLQSGGAGMVAAGVVASAPAFVAAKAAMSFEDAMADANKVLNLTNDELAQMKRETLEQSKRLPLTPLAIAQIKAAGAEMRIAKGELNAFAEDASKMAVAFGMEAGDAGAQMATWRTSFSLSQPEVAKLADKINALTNRMGGNNKAISDIITKVGPLGQIAGVAAGEMAAMAATLDTTGVQADVAGTGIKNMMLAMTKGSAATKQQAEAFKSLGLNVGAISKRMQTDAQGAITDVLERIKRLSPDKQASVLTQLFGSESVGAIAPMLTKLDDLKARFSLVGDASAYSGSMTNEFLARMGTTSAQMQLASNKVDVLKTKLGDRLLPYVVKAADMVGSLADRMDAWAERNPGLTNTLVVLASMIGPLLIGMGALGIIAGPIVKGFGVIALVLGKLGPVLGLARTAFMILATGIRYAGMLMMTNPIILIIAAIAAAVYLIYANWGTIGPWLAKLWGTIKALFNAGLEWFNGLVARMGTIGTNIVQGIWNGIIGAKDWLMAKLAWFANLIPAPIRKALGIHSPSRVFAAIGGHVMAGLDQGLDDGSGGPLARVANLSNRMTKALTIGAIGPAIAGAVPAMAQPGGGGATAALPAGGNTYNISIKAEGGNPQDIADKVREVIAQIEREHRGRGFGDY